MEPVADLETVRNLVDKLELNGGPSKDHAGNAMPKLSPDWCFVDCTCDEDKSYCSSCSRLLVI